MKKILYIDGIYRIKRRKPKKFKFWYLLLPLLLIIDLFIFAPKISSALDKKIDFAKIYRNLDGNYLILFQNNNELRPSGGFIGSYAIFSFKNGHFDSYYFESNPYKRDNAFLKENCLPSTPYFKKLWPEHCMKMVDANYLVDFPESAKNVAWFLKEEGGPQVNGVIAIDATFFTELLKILGPIEIKEENLVLNSENFVEVAQYQVEKAYWKDPESKEINEPKTILKNMMPEVLQRIKNPLYVYPILNLIEKSLKEKNFLIYLENPEISKIISENNWGGEVTEKNTDYLFISNMNIHGFKSSLNIKQEIEIETEKEHHLKIKRTHQGTGEWPDALNRNYLRALVPKGSKLKKALLENVEVTNEVEINEEAGKTSFGIFVDTPPKESRTLEFFYETPEDLDFSKILIQKQPGTLADEILIKEKNQILYQGLLDQDLFINRNSL